MCSLITGGSSRNEELAPLYQRLVPEGFETLPETLRAFHSSATGAIAVGTATVERGGTWLKNRLADWMGFPPAGDQIPLELRVQVCGGHEFWIRDFDGFQLRTEQWLEHGMLMESAGPVRLSLKVSSIPTGFLFESRAQHVFGIPIPQVFAMKVNAWATGQPGGWVFEVDVRAPLFGRLVRYRGEVKLK